MRPRKRGAVETLICLLKKNQTFFAKPLDKSEKMWYNNQAVPKRGRRDRSLKIEQQEKYKANKWKERISENYKLENSFIEREGKLLTKKPRIKKLWIEGNDASIVMWDYTII